MAMRALNHGTLPALEDLFVEAAAGDVIRSYFADRAIKTTATLALLAKDEEHLSSVLITPLMSGWEKQDGSRISLAEAEKPIAEAILKHLWNEANSSWQAQMTLRHAPPVTSVPGAISLAAANPVAEEKIPRQLPPGVWANLLHEYQSQQIGGVDRIFPVNELLGTDKILARVYYEHTSSKTYSPVGLGELVAARTFTAAGEPNPLAKKDRSTTTLLLNDAKLVAAPEEAWQPRSVLAVLDGLASIRWCFILLKLGSEQAVHSYFDWLTRLVRSRPQKTEQFGQFFITISWKLATAMRSGQSFDAAASLLMKDLDVFSECMSREASSSTKKSNNTEKTGPQKGSGKGGGKSKFGQYRSQPYARQNKTWTAPYRDGNGAPSQSTWHPEASSPARWSSSSWPSDWNASGK